MKFKGKLAVKSFSDSKEYVELQNSHEFEVHMRKRFSFPVKKKKVFYLRNVKDSEKVAYMRVQNFSTMVNSYAYATIFKYS